MKIGLKLAYITLPLIAIGVGVLAYVVATSEPPARTALAERTTAVRIIIAKKQSVVPQISGFGLVSPARIYEAIAQVGGTAEFVNGALQGGSILPAGTVLARLSPTDFNLAIAQARANIRAAEARLAELEVSAQNQAAALAIEKQALALKAKELERAEVLFSGGTLSQSSRDNARTAHLAQRQKVLAVESSLALVPTQKAVQTEQIAVYQANLKTATLNLERTELKLPFAARVASIAVEVGQFVRAGQTIAVLDGINAAEIEAQVSIADLRGLLQSSRPDAASLGADPTQMAEVLHSLGLRADVQLRLGDEVLTWVAEVDRISDTIDPKTGTLGVIVRVDTAYAAADPGGRPPLTKGMFVKVSLYAPAASGVVIPRSALRAGKVLIAQDDNRLAEKPVSPFLVQGDIALITEGLEPGTRIVATIPNPVVPGTLLEVTEDTALMARMAAESSGEESGEKSGEGSGE